MADAFTCVVCASTNTFNLYELHNNLCHPGVRRLSHYVRSKNLPFSMEDVKEVCSTCNICAELKPRFHRLNQGTLIKATKPFERISLDFKGPLPSSSRNVYLLVIIDEYSRFPFCYPCPNMHTETVIKCLNDVFTLCGVSGFVHSDNASYFTSRELKNYLFSRGIATSHSSIYHPQGNSQVERYSGIIWRSIRLALKSCGLDITKRESVLPDVLHSLRSLLCTATNATPHELLFNFHRKSYVGHSLPTWLTETGPVYLRNFNPAGKNDDFVRKVELTEANPWFARVKFSNGREATVSLKDLAPIPSPVERVLERDCFVKEIVPNESVVDPKSCNDVAFNESVLSPKSCNDIGNLNELDDEPQPKVRRSDRTNKGAPPSRYGEPVTF